MTATPAPFGPHFGFGLYVHWPYCTRICPYCDFNVYAAKDRDSGPLVDAIAADIHAHRPRMPDHLQIVHAAVGESHGVQRQAHDPTVVDLAAREPLGFAHATSGSAS